MPPTPQPPQPAGVSLDWLDTPDSRRWLSSWLLVNWPQLFQNGFRQLHALDYNRAYDGMEKAMRRLTHRLPNLTAICQLQAIQGAACNLGLTTTSEAMLRTLLTQLEFHLIHISEKPPKKPRKASQADIRKWEHATNEWRLLKRILNASPWAAIPARRKRSLENAGLALCAKHYPGNPDCQLALRRVMAILSAVEIQSGPTRSTIALRRVQRGLFAAVRRLSRLEDGLRRLSVFLASLLRAWPRIPAGLSFELHSHFHSDRLRACIRDHLHLATGQSTKEAVALWRVVHAAIYREDLRSSLLTLAFGEEQRKEAGSTRVWEHLSAALADAITFVTRARSQQEQVTDLLLSAHEEARGISPSWFLASKVNAVLKLIPAEKFDRAPEGKTSAEVMVRRAHRKLKRHYGLD